MQRAGGAALNSAPVPTVKMQQHAVVAARPRATRAEREHTAQPRTRAPALACPLAAIKVKHQPRVPNHPQLQPLNRIQHAGTRACLRILCALHTRDSPQRTGNACRHCNHSACSARDRAPDNSRIRTHRPAFRRGQPHSKQIRLRAGHCCGQCPLLPRYVLRMHLQQHAAISHSHELVGGGSAHTAKCSIYCNRRGVLNVPRNPSQHHCIHILDPTLHGGPSDVVYDTHVVCVCHQVCQRNGHLLPGAIERPLHVVVQLHFTARRIPRRHLKAGVQG